MPAARDFCEQRVGIVRKAQVFRREAVREIASGFERRRKQDCAGIAHRRVRGIVWREIRQLRLHFFLDGVRQFKRRRYQKTSRVGRMLGLREQISRDPFRIALCRENDGFRRACRKIDGAIAADELLCGGDKAIAGPEDFIHTGDVFCAVGERSDRLRAADAGNSRYAQQTARRQAVRDWVWGKRR